MTVRIKSETLRDDATFPQPSGVPMSKKLPATTLVVRGLPTMTYHQRRAIAKWLREKAREVSAKGAGERYAARFTARYY